MKKSLSTIAIIGLIFICLFLLFRRNNYTGESLVETDEEVLPQKDVTHYLDERLANLLLDHIDYFKNYPEFKVVKIIFDVDYKKPVIYFITSPLYRAVLLKNGHFELDGFLILFGGKESPLFDNYVHSENLEVGIPEGFINEISDEYEDVVGGFDMRKIIYIDENGELIPE